MYNVARNLKSDIKNLGHIYNVITFSKSIYNTLNFDEVYAG